MKSYEMWNKREIILGCAEKKCEMSLPGLLIFKFLDGSIPCATSYGVYIRERKNNAYLYFGIFYVKIEICW